MRIGHWIEQLAISDLIDEVLNQQPSNHGLELILDRWVFVEIIK